MKVIVVDGDEFLKEIPTVKKFIAFIPGEYVFDPKKWLVKGDYDDLEEAKKDCKKFSEKHPLGIPLIVYIMEVKAVVLPEDLYEYYKKLIDVFRKRLTPAQQRRLEDFLSFPKKLQDSKT